ncbi:MAG: TMEM165/GDT1 family protein [Spirochaetia bacterium]|nr:TMEM165/GDT1 family protein [Spirochaetia bacterium]
MDLKAMFGVFITIFLAELGDKTQLATVLYASDREVSKLLVFTGASLALIATSAIGVFAGNLLSQYINPEYITKIAGVGFVLIGVWMFFKS